MKAQIKSKVIGNVPGVNYAKLWLYADPNHGLKKEDHLPVKLYEYTHDVETSDFITKLSDVETKLKTFCKSTGRKMKTKVTFNTDGHDSDSFCISIQYLEEESDKNWENRIITAEIHAKEYADRRAKEEAAMKIKMEEHEKKLYKELHKKYGRKEIK